jgi:hypothetical protein
LSHIDVSKALHIIGMFMPKLGLVPFFGTATLAAPWRRGGGGGVVADLGRFRSPLP